MAKTFIKLGLVLALIGLSACETIKGAGRDITKAGRAIDRAI